MHKKFRPYPKMKPSGIPWLGEIPEHWTIQPVWGLFRMGRGRVISNEEIIDHPGPYPVYSSQTENQGIMGHIDSFDFEGEYITWTTDGAKAGTVFYRSGKFNCTNVCGILKQRGELSDLRFMVHALNCTTSWFVRHDINPKLMNNVMAKIKIQVPPLEEQHLIASFLDRETGRIDGLIEKKERLIELLKEKRQALISHAVTKGLNPNAKMKPSGIPWLGEIPEHWRVNRLCAIGTFSASGIDKKIVEGEPIVSMVNYLDIYANPQKVLDRNRSYMVVSCPPQKLKEHSVKKGDILFTPSSETPEEIGFSAVAIEDLPNTVYSYHIIRFRPTVELDLNFSKYFCNCSQVLAQFTSVCKGTTRQILTRDDFKNVIICLPPIDEQRAIASFLDRETGKIDVLIDKVRRSIELLREYRTALISAAVTGKIDVRDRDL